MVAAALPVLTIDYVIDIRGVTACNDCGVEVSASHARKVNRVLIDPQVEELIPIKSVCTMFPGRSGAGISLSSVWRWILHGRKGHKLNSILVGGQRYTSRQAVARFLAEINKEPLQEKRLNGAQETSAARVEQELKANRL